MAPRSHNNSKLRRSGANWTAEMPKILDCWSVGASWWREHTGIHKLEGEIYETKWKNGIWCLCVPIKKKNTNIYIYIYICILIFHMNWWSSWTIYYVLWCILWFRACKNQAKLIKDQDKNIYAQVGLSPWFGDGHITVIWYAFKKSALNWTIVHEKCRF